MRMGRKRVAWEFATGVASDGHDPALELYPVQGSGAQRLQKGWNINVCNCMAKVDGDRG